MAKRIPLARAYFNKSDKMKTIDIGNSDNNIRRIHFSTHLTGNIIIKNPKLITDFTVSEKKDI